MVNVIGLGYIGLPTALMMASHGVEIVGTDYNKELVSTLNRGEITFEEKGLKELFEDAVAAGIKFSDEYQVTDKSYEQSYDKITQNSYDTCGNNSGNKACAYCYKEGYHC